MAEAAPGTASTDARGVSRIFPDLDDDLLLHLFHKGARAQWTSRDLDFGPPLQLDARQRGALARLLTPVYFGEQTAMAGASGVLPQLMRARETSAQLYLASFIMDEARHFEALTQLYRALGHDPLGLRDIPELLLYHHRLRQGDRADWVWGILISDVIGKHFYRVLRTVSCRARLVGTVEAHTARRIAPPCICRALPAPQRRAHGAARDARRCSACATICSGCCRR